ncbi:hypothetical protein FWK35_00001992 [Aphis craccivora]|uniref:Uncharacterized protein n=1 Tax=Aphis craccivora TaxID=307492 RepID=A0A6G0ZRX7_APHCR|nr:hypothetical protein FWK35_00001992 [Aphis craccivora]
MKFIIFIVSLNYKKAGKWVPLCCTLGAVWITIYCRTVKFESNDNYEKRKTILNEDDLSA